MVETARPLSYEEACDAFYSQPVKALHGGGEREIGFSCSIHLEAGRWLYDLVVQRKPERILEVGLAWGGSAIHLSAGQRDNGGGLHIAIDPLQNTVWSGIGASEIRRLGLGDRPDGQDGFRLVERRSDALMPELLEKGEKFQFIFIDGDHSFHAVFVDLYFAEKLLDVGGLLILDDARHPPIVPILSYIATNMTHLRPVPHSFRRFAAYEKVGQDERDSVVLHDF
jgi:predicted O-methyltransferase YrrM